MAGDGVGLKPWEGKCLVFAHCLQTCFLVHSVWFWCLLFLWVFTSTCSVPLSCCFSIVLLAALTEALSMFLQALS